MYVKYNNLILLSFYLEKMSTTFWTSKALTNKHSIYCVSSQWSYLLFQIFRNELTLGLNFLVENSGVDLSNANYFFYRKSTTRCFSTLPFYTLYFYFLKAKITVFVGNSNTISPLFSSIDSIFNNANWLERETSEMYNLLYKFKVDGRRILLDYSKIENPLLKKFPCEGYNDLFYNIFENQVTIKQSETVEL